MTTAEQAAPPKRRWVMLLGLTIALLAPFAATFLPQPADFAERALRGSVVSAAITIVVLIIVVVLERQPLSSIGFKRLGWGALGFGLLGLIACFLSNPLSGLILHAVGGKEPVDQIRQLGGLPVWILMILPFRAAITEEILFRGYAMTRVQALTGSRFLAFILPAALFCVAHAPFFGLAYALAVGPLAIVLGLLFLWRKNLWANIIAHAGVDAVGLTLTWAVAHGLIDLPK
jgi:membrane protease YdiL (CAAX protease family)